MNALSIIGCISVLAIGVTAAETKRVELAPKTYLIIDRQVHNGMIEGSASTTLAIEWPSSIFHDKIGQADGFNETGEARLLKTDAYYILIYGRSLYHRPVQGGTWAWWPVRNSSFVPPVPSVSAYLKDWLEEHGRADFEYLPYGDHPSDEQVAFERISFRPSPDQEPIVFGSRTGWTLPYRFSVVDVAKNTVRYETSMPGLPRVLVFTGPPKFFGAWEFSPDATSKANQ